MKPQDIIFFIMVGFLIFKQSPKLAATLGIICLILAMPLFATWIFFTAQRLTWYAAAFFLLAIIPYLFRIKNNE